MNLIIKVK